MQPVLVFFVIPTFWPQNNARIVLTMTRAFRRYPICRGPFNQSGSGSGRAPTWVRAMLQLAVRELQYVLQHTVIDKIIVSKKLVLVISLHFSVALDKTQLASQPPQPWPPLAEIAPKCPI